MSNLQITLIETAKKAFDTQSEVSGAVGQFEFKLHFKGFNLGKKEYSREYVFKTFLTDVRKLEKPLLTQRSKVCWESNDYANLEFTDWTEPKVLEAITAKIAKLEKWQNDPEELSRLKRILPQVRQLQGLDPKQLNSVI